ncbi:MAG: prepilin-type N-terminal cleavage/methylation domain-containing protein [Phycisphaerae bacterium]
MALLATHHPHTPPRGVTLIEVLVAMLVLSIVLPVAMHGMSLITNAASLARQRTQATTLAQSKLNELMITGGWRNGAQSGTFAEPWQEYQWRMASESWEAPMSLASGKALEHVLLEVTFTCRNKPYQVALDTLVYDDGSTSGLSGGLTQ